MKENIVLRKATVSDYSKVKSLSQSVLSKDYLIDYYYEIIKDKNNHLFVLENYQKEIIGCVNAVIVDFTPEKIGYVKALRVKADYQGQGIGTYLTKEAVDFFKDFTDVEQVCYGSYLINWSSVNVALNNGFKEISRWPAAILDIEEVGKLITKPINNDYLFSDEEILKFMLKEDLQWFNCHWDFYPPSLSLINHLRSFKENGLYLSYDNEFLSYYTYEKERLMANYVGKVSEDGIKELLNVILTRESLKKYNEIRIFVQEQQQELFSEIPIMDFSQRKGVRFFVKKLINN